MDWLKKHVDTVIVLSGILSSVIWMNSKFSSLEKEMGNLDKEVAIIKTVMIMRNIMPAELAQEQNMDLHKKKISPE